MTVSTHNDAALRDTTLPVIDIDVFRNGGPELDQRVRLLDEVCRDVGFFAVVGHQIPSSLIDAVFDHARDFFALPLVDRMAISIDQSTNHTGYVPLEQELLQPGLRGDHKESLDLSLEPLVSQWPAMPVFQEVMVTYQQAVLEVAEIVMRGLALALGLSAGYFERAMRQPECNLRLLHYPPAPHPSTDGQRGCGAHTDYGLITLLATADTPGLEVQRHDGQWQQAIESPGALVVNLGDMLARWTNDRYVSTPHRVVSLPGCRRYSVPFFVNPDPGTLIEPLPSCVSATNPSRYDPIRSDDYLRSRFDATHTYRR